MVSFQYQWYFLIQSWRVIFQPWVERQCLKRRKLYNRKKKICLQNFVWYCAWNFTTTLQCTSSRYIALARRFNHWFFCTKQFWNNSYHIWLIFCLWRVLTILNTKACWKRFHSLLVFNDFFSHKDIRYASFVSLNTYQGHRNWGCYGTPNIFSDKEKSSV